MNESVEIGGLVGCDVLRLSQVEVVVDSVTWLAVKVRVNESGLRHGERQIAPRR